MSPDRHVAFQQIYPPGKSAIELKTIAKATEEAAEAALPAGTSVYVTGRDAIFETDAKGETEGPGVDKGTYTHGDEPPAPGKAPPTRKREAKPRAQKQQTAKPAA